MKSVKDQVLDKPYLNQDVHLDVINMIQKVLWCSRLWQMHSYIWDVIREIFDHEINKE